ncbi:CotY/CotZ family spore coat protein [Psychrobacillus psychrodurans]|uniref:CotY/CotZ family spore coat protein n=1 Tax=Psychrobacillus psychrodurans TaxID=126157 RepID=A0A9X3LAN4_9BACI|nr:CotY/CotZ family spore coat protein [Psychrobacillus psychrodurans]MCZ8534533.1 CotY/CotZ family spore coat protein [Psychrobacillus psychrodurans]
MSSESCNYICEAFYELKLLQDFLQDSQTKFFGNLLAKIVGTDTIPFLLTTTKGDLLTISSVQEGFETNYFRIELVDLEKCCVTISLLRPIDIEGNVSNAPCDVVRLEKTSICRVIDTDIICAIQTLETKMLTRKIIIEPKW